MYNNIKVKELKKTYLRNSWLLDQKNFPLHLVSESILFCFFIFHVVVEGGGGGGGVTSVSQFLTLSGRIFLI